MTIIKGNFAKEAHALDEDLEEERFLTNKKRKPKRFTARVMEHEMLRWEQQKIPPLSCYLLTRIYMGMSKFLSPEGIYPIYQLAPLAERLGVRQSSRLLEMLCQSGSFTFICDNHLSCCYGFYSRLSLRTETLEKFQIAYPELYQIPVEATLSALFAQTSLSDVENALSLKTEKESKLNEEASQPNEDSLKQNDDDPLNDDTLKGGNLEKKAALFTEKGGDFEKKVALFAKKVADFGLKVAAFCAPSETCNIYNKYVLINNIYPSLKNHPPLEDTPLACKSSELSLPDPDTLPLPADMSSKLKEAAGTGKRKRAQKIDYGSALEYFHEMNQTDEGRAVFFLPHRTFIAQKYHISYAETKFVMTHIVKDFLIPKFDRDPKFRTTPPKSRDCWLRALIKTAGYQHELDIQFSLSMEEIKRFRKEEEEKRCDDLRSYRPNSPYEWTSRLTGNRMYQDPANGVIDLPVDAAPRPSATARWNKFIHQWEDRNPA